MMVEVILSAYFEYLTFEISLLDFSVLFTCLLIGWRHHNMTNMPANWLMMS